MPDPKPDPERRRRRALSHGARKAEIVFDEVDRAAALVRALNVPLDDEAVSPHIHGFHSYPARMHPDTAARLVGAVSEPGDRVLDPFCGSGTVLAEAQRLGRAAAGVDANPFAVVLAQVKLYAYSPADLAELVVAAERVAAHAEGRRKAKAGPSRKYGPEDRELFEVHVLLELDGLADGLLRERSGPQRSALELVLSAILVKVSRQPGDTAADRKPRRLAGGYAIRLFLLKANELAERIAEYRELLPERVEPVRVFAGDARVLDRIPTGAVDAIVTSPPYPGVYDYIDHHAVRLRWLGIREASLARAEIGSRRGAERRSAGGARTTWERDFGECLHSMARVLRPGGFAAVVLADSVLGGRAVRADEYVPRLAGPAGLECVAAVRQARPHFHRDTQNAFRDGPRYEHVLLLARTSSERAARGPARAAPSRPRGRSGERSSRD